MSFHFMWSLVLSNASLYFIIRGSSLISERIPKEALLVQIIKAQMQEYLIKFVQRALYPFVHNRVLYVILFLNAKQLISLCYLLSCVCAKFQHHKVKTMVCEHCSILILTLEYDISTRFFRLSKLTNYSDSF